MSEAEGAGGLEIRQTYPHPVAEVFAAWSDPSRVRPWWGPKDFTATVFDCDFREGGVWHAVIVGPDGKPLGQGGRYTRIETDRLLAFTFRWDVPDAPETDITVKFEDRGGSTAIVFRQALFASAESRRSHEGGWSECLDRLASHLGGRDG